MVTGSCSFTGAFTQEHTECELLECDLGAGASSLFGLQSGHNKQMRSSNRQFGVYCGKAGGLARGFVFSGFHGQQVSSKGEKLTTWKA